MLLFPIKKVKFNLRSTQHQESPSHSITAASAQAWVAAGPSTAVSGFLSGAASDFFSGAADADSDFAARMMTVTVQIWRASDRFGPKKFALGCVNPLLQAVDQQDAG